MSAGHQDFRTLSGGYMGKNFFRPIPPSKSPKVLLRGPEKREILHARYVQRPVSCQSVKNRRAEAPERAVRPGL